MSKIIEAIENEQMGKEIPKFAPGDTVVVQVKVKEGNRERLQAFEGVVIAKRNRGLNSSFTVRKISHGEGVERVFQTYSPVVDSLKVKRRGDVRRAKLYYLRGRTGKEVTQEQRNLYEKLHRDRENLRRQRSNVGLRVLSGRPGRGSCPAPSVRRVSKPGDSPHNVACAER